MIARAAASLAALAALSGCDLLFPEDPRVGEEAQQACVSRVEGALRLELKALDAEPDAAFVPTYTYDITKLGLEEIQALSQSRFDETEGSRLNRATNMTDTAVEIFMAEPVDENGAFFMATDPALYRVRGEAAAFADIIAQGCERQQADMRLIDVDFAAADAADTETDPTDTPEDESN